MRLSKILLLVLTIVSLELALSLPANAFLVSIQRSNLASEGKFSTSLVYVKNFSDRPLPIEATIYAQTQEANNKRIFTDGEDDFLISPTQLIIPPNTTEYLSLRYIGEPNPDIEKAFKLSVKNFALASDYSSGKLSDKQTVSVGLVADLQLDVFVEPKNPYVKPIVKKAILNYPKKELSLTIENEGNQHVICFDFIIRSKDQSQYGKLKIEPEVSQKIFAKTSQTFTIPWGDNPNLGYDITRLLNISFNKRF